MARPALPSLTGLRAFEAFARSGSMTVAADELCVTHGAISRQVRALELRLGLALTSGPKHQLKLTPAGAEMAAALTTAFDVIGAALPGAGPTQELVVSCLGTLAMKWLIPRLPEFLDAHRGVTVRILESHAPVDFNQGVHGAIRISDCPWPAGTKVMPFMEHFHGPVLSPALLAQAGGDPGAMLALPRLRSETFRPAWSQWAARCGVDLPAAVDREFEHNSYMLEAAAAGIGVAIAPWAFAAADIERGRLVAPLGFEAVESGFVYLRPRLGDNKAAAAFGDWLRDEGRRGPAPPKAIRLA
jgi:DNA-binding transcriptional LysR family regulator